VAKVPRVQPADAYLAEIADRTRRKQEAYERHERHGGETAVKCASAMIELFNENNMPKALQGRILLGLHRVHDAGLLVVSPDIPVALKVCFKARYSFQFQSWSLYSDQHRQRCSALGTIGGCKGQI
jgi:hypothetical protein